MDGKERAASFKAGDLRMLWGMPPVSSQSSILILAKCIEIIVEKLYNRPIYYSEKRKQHMRNRDTKLRISFNSPVILTFTILCFLAMLLNNITDGASNTAFFSVYRSPLLSLQTYIRFFGHVIGHAGWEHLFGNIMLILVVGPLLEEKYGSANLLFVILATALATGLVHFIFFPRIMLLGASGVVFALILLSSITCVGEGEIPLTFILVAAIYIGQQIYEGLFVHDNISNLTHILGGIVGASLGFVMNRNRMSDY